MAQRDDEPPTRPHAGVTILVVRSGGFAGISQQWRVEAHDDAQEWLELVHACPWGAVGQDPASRDRFVWRIEAHLLRTVRKASVPDAHLVGPWRALVDRVQEAATSG